MKSGKAVIRSILMGLFVVPLFCGADVPPKTPEHMMEEADAVIVGTIRDVVAETKVRDQHGGKAKTTTHASKILVEKIEKGKDLNVGDVVTVHTWHYDWTGPGLPPPGNSGHFHTPAKGQRVRVYYETAGNGKNHVVLQEGMVPVGK